jgi:glycosyltransferase involved in cell wall biosynthesis
VILGGDNAHSQKLKMLVKALSLEQDVIFPGFVNTSDLPLFYNGADLFVYPSLYEGFGLPPIEAMACGTPVVTSNVSSLPEVVGEAAITVNPRDTLELAEAMLKVLQDKSTRNQLIAKGLEQCKIYNWDSNATKVLEIYQKVLGS